MKKARFRIRTAQGEEAIALPSPEAVMSKAITRAVTSTEAGTWDVIEYDDVLYRIVRADTPEMDIRVLACG